MAGFKNAARFKRRLKAIAPAMRKAARQQLADNARELVEAQKRVAPVQGAPEVGGELRDSIKAQDTSNAQRIAQTVSAGGPATQRPVRKSEKGGAPLYDYAMAQELGTEKMAANPFFFPPYRAKRKTFKAKMNRAMKGAAQSAARKS